MKCLSFVLDANPVAGEWSIETW